MIDKIIMEKVTNIDSELNNLQFDIKPTSNVRMIAVKILNRYDRSDSYIDKLLSNAHKNEDLNPQDRALLTELVNGCIRWRNRLDWILTGFYHGDFQKCLNLVKNAMRIALYQMLFLNRIPIAAAIYESVEIVKIIQGEKSAGIVNGVLRNIARNLENIRYPERGEDDSYYYAVFYSFPRWMIKRWIDSYGDENAVKLMNYFNKRPYVPVRVNTLKANIEEVKEIFDKYNVGYKEFIYDINSLILESPRYDISQSEMFKRGLITIQDPSATLAAKLSGAKEGDLVYDLCAAPGGKSFVFAEMMKNKGKIIAMDKHASKLKFIKEGSERLGYNIIETLEADASTISLEQKADIVFVDAPCSGLGTIPKKVDIKWKREPEDIVMLSYLQKQIIENATKLVKIGGALVYSTCTIEPEENIEILKYTLEKFTNFELDNAAYYIDSELTEDGYYRTIPYLHNIDGAFGFRLIRKK